MVIECKPKFTDEIAVKNVEIEEEDSDDDNDE